MGHHVLNVTDSGQEALAIYEDLDLKSLQLEALEALAAACKAGEAKLATSRAQSIWHFEMCVIFNHFSTIFGMLIPTDESICFEWVETTTNHF